MQMGELLNMRKTNVSAVLLGILCLFGVGCVTARTVSMCYGADGHSMARGGLVTRQDIQYADYVRKNLPEMMGSDKRYMVVKPRSRYVEVEIFGDMKQSEADVYGKKVEEYRAKHPEVCPIKLILTVLPDGPAK